MNLHQSNKIKQYGATILEALAALAITSTLVVSIGLYLGDKSGAIKDQSTIQFQNMVNRASVQYIRQNFSTITAAATATTPAVYPLSSLISAGFVPASFSSSTTNPYGQTSCLIVLKPSANVLLGMVVTEGGDTISDKKLMDMASKLGPSGGYIPSSSPTTAIGAFGKWSQSLTNYTSANCSGVAATTGHFASTTYYDSNNLMQGYVYRTPIAAHQEATTMTAPLIVSLSTPATIAASCSSYASGTIANDSSGNILVCKSGTWQNTTATGGGHWKDPVATIAALGTCNASTQYDIRFVVDQASAMFCTGSAWTAFFGSKWNNTTGALDGYYTSNSLTVIANKVRLNPIAYNKGLMSQYNDCNSGAYGYGTSMNNVAKGSFGLTNYSSYSSFSSCTPNPAGGNYWKSPAGQVNGWADPVASIAALNAITTDPDYNIRFVTATNKIYFSLSGVWYPVNLGGFTVNSDTTTVADMKTAACSGSACVATATCSTGTFTDGFCSGDSNGIGSSTGTGWTCTANSTGASAITAFAFCKN